MNRNKFDEIVHKATGEINTKTNTIGQITPENWSEHKKVLQDGIKELDEAVEIYHMENAKKDKL